MILSGRTAFEYRYTLHVIVMDYPARPLPGITKKDSDKYGDGPDPYTYLNSQGLINKFGITNDDQFIEMEKDFSELAIMDIKFSPPPYDLRY
ncbi:hypothetical protein [Yersinia thracica]|uniref:hypothetical protein n=1 Tax=Yersinia thracica TaxID=2890319 RepID=UPI001F46FBC9|nr:hypothetical protein [Yersinia thracica]